MATKQKGRVYYLKARNRYYVSWYHRGKEFKVYRQINGDRLETKAEAEALLTIIRAEAVRGTLDIRRYVKSYTDAGAYIVNWHKTKKDQWKPSTYRTYAGHIKNFIGPFFEVHPRDIADIRLDTLTDFLNWIPQHIAGSTKKGIFNCLHSAMDFAWRSERIRAIPPFPRNNEFGIVEPELKWMNEADQLKVLEKIEEKHKPIFYWLKYHLRRIAEARALHLSDYDPKTDTFTIQRTISDRELVNRTKTNEVHVIPCHPDFKPILDKMLRERRKFRFISPFMFVCGSSYHMTRRYTQGIMIRIWKNALKAAGMPYINMYNGLKHSSATQYLNEKGMSLTDLMAITGHKQLDTVSKYAKHDTRRIRELMATPKLVDIKKKRKAVEST